MKIFDFEKYFSKNSFKKKDKKFSKKVDIFQTQKWKFSLKKCRLFSRFFQSFFFGVFFRSFWKSYSKTLTISSRKWHQISAWVTSKCTWKGLSTRFFYKKLFGQNLHSITLFWRSNSLKNEENCPLPQNPSSQTKKTYLWQFPVHFQLWLAALLLNYTVQTAIFTVCIVGDMRPAGDRKYW